jgi:tight adherence protein C
MTPSRRRSSEARAVALPDAIELIVVSIRAGRSPSEAVREAAPLAADCLGPAFAAFEHRSHRGAGFADALVAFGEVVGPVSLPLVEAMAHADRYGLPLTPVLDRLVDEARSERRRHAASAARRLPVSLSFPLVTCSLPAFVLLAIVPAVLGAVAALGDSLP